MQTKAYWHQHVGGNVKEVLSDLEKKMLKQSEELMFEEAASTRDLIASIKHTTQKQKITDSDLDDKDVIAMSKGESDAVVQVFFIRAGKLIGREHFLLNAASRLGPE